MKIFVIEVLFDACDEDIDVRVRDGRDFSQGQRVVGQDYEHLCKFMNGEDRIVSYISIYIFFLFKLYVFKQQNCIF